MPDQPNVLLLIIDQLRGDALRCVGHPNAVTPHIDRLAARGVTFRRHYAQGSPCGPSRASIATGMYVMNHRVITNDAPTAQHLKTLPMFARELGYEPALVGYTTTVPDPRHAHANDPRFTTNSIAGGWNIVRDFEEPRAHYLAWLSGQGYTIPDTYEQLFRPPPGEHDPTWFAPSPIAEQHTDTAWCAEGALDYLRIRAKKPWFMHLGFFRPHPPLMPSAPWHQRVHPKDTLPPVRAASAEAEAAVHPLTKLILDTMKVSSAMHWMPGLARDLSLADVGRMRAAYFGLLAEVDHHVGRVMQLLQDTGQLERTLIVLTSDHGEQLGDHHLVAKRGYFPQSYHVPCIVVDPRPEADATRGKQVQAFTENVDVLPTIMQWLGAPVPRQCNGRSLLPFTRSPGPSQWRREAHWEYDFRDLAGGAAHERLGIPRDDCSLAVQLDERFAYVHCAALPPLMFHLPSDPHWLVNVADDPAHREAALHCTRRMLDWRLSQADRTLTGYAISKQGLRQFDA
ncbi:MAG: sulfatase-like hydrolase/transferase [Rubrivivax sp.]|nr:sulfatase-like hydrolase/transferase [Rubrivivax sp.]